MKFSLESHYPVKFPRTQLQPVDLSEIRRLDQLAAIDTKPYRVYAHDRPVSRRALLEREKGDPFEIPEFLRNQAE